MDKKICPLTYSVGKGGYYCVEKRCAWWIGKTHPLDVAKEGCAILLLARGSK